MENIYLIGIMGCGKTTLGKRLAREKSMEFVDMDNFIEKRSGLSIPEIFDTFGEAHFRELETKAARELSEKHGLVVATGGGPVTRGETMSYIKAGGRVVFIDRPLDNILSDIDASSRPLIRDNPGRLEKILSDRLDLYRRYADIILKNTGSKAEAIDNICKSLASLDKSTHRYAVIGDPISHSLSPVIHLPVLREYEPFAEYERALVKRGEISGWIDRVKTEGIAGFNLTMPHKEDILPFLDGVDDEARFAGSVNTVVNRSGRLWGYTTDGAGFFKALSGAGISYEGKSLLILGAGGASRALALRAVMEGAGSVVILARSREKAESVSRFILGHIPGAAVLAGSLDSVTELCPKADILINATPQGMAHSSGDWESLAFLESLKPGAVVCDLIYAPEKTKFLEYAERLGHVTQNGLSMLIYQALVSDSLYLDMEIDFSRMAKTAREAVQKTIKGE